MFLDDIFLVYLLNCPQRSYEVILSDNLSCINSIIFGMSTSDLRRDISRNLEQCEHSRKMEAKRIELEKIRKAEQEYVEYFDRKKS